MIKKFTDIILNYLIYGNNLVKLTVIYIKMIFMIIMVLFLTIRLIWIIMICTNTKKHYLYIVLNRGISE